MSNICPKLRRTGFIVNGKLKSITSDRIYFQWDNAPVSKKFISPEFGGCRSVRFWMNLIGLNPNFNENGEWIQWLLFSGASEISRTIVQHAQRTVIESFTCTLNCVKTKMNRAEACRKLDEVTVSTILTVLIQKVLQSTLGSWTITRVF